MKQTAKRIITAMLTSILCLSTFAPASAQAVTVPLFTVSATEAHADQYTFVSLSLTDNPGISGAALTLYYDKASIEYINAAICDGLTVDRVHVMHDIETGELKFTFTDTAECFHGEGELLRMKFRILDDSMGNVGVYLTETARSVTDSEFVFIEYGISNGNVLEKTPSAQHYIAYGSSLKKNTDSFLTGCRRELTVNGLFNEVLNHDGEVLTADGVKLGNEAFVGTGCILKCGGLAPLTVTVKGDLDGDGEITAADYILLRRSFKNEYGLSEAEKIAADTDCSGTSTSSDIITLKRFLNGTVEIALG